MNELSYAHVSPAHMTTVFRQTMAEEHKSDDATTPINKVLRMQCLLGNETPLRTHDFRTAYGYTLGNAKGFEIVLKGAIAKQLASASCVADAMVMPMFVSNNGIADDADGTEAEAETYIEISEWKGSTEFNRLWSQSVMLEFKVPITASDLEESMEIRGTLPSVESVDMLMELDPDILDFPIGSRSMLTRSANGHKLVKQVLKKRRTFDNMMAAKAQKGITGQLEFSFVHRVQQWSATRLVGGEVVVMVSFPTNQPIMHSLSATITNVNPEDVHALKKVCITLGTNVASLSLGWKTTTRTDSENVDVIVEMPTWTVDAPLLSCLGGNVNLAMLFEKKPTAPVHVTLHGHTMSLSTQALAIMKNISYLLQPIAETETHIILLLYMRNCVGLLKRPKDVDSSQVALEKLTGAVCATLPTA